MQSMIKHVEYLVEQKIEPQMLVNDIHQEEIIIQKYPHLEDFAKTHMIIMRQQVTAALRQGCLPSCIIVLNGAVAESKIASMSHTYTMSLSTADEQSDDKIDILYGLTASHLIPTLGWMHVHAGEGELRESCLSSRAYVDPCKISSGLCKFSNVTSYIEHSESTFLVKCRSREGPRVCCISLLLVGHCW